MIRVVIDTNVFVRYFIKPGAAVRQLIRDVWLEGDITLITAPELLEELEAVVGRGSLQPLLQPSEVHIVMNALQFRAEVLPALGPIPALSRDPKDDKFIACAIAGKADYLISLDKDLLALGRVEAVQIMTPHEFLNRRLNEETEA